MTKEEWLEAFETINGRKPSVAELGQAMQNGEIIDESASKSAVEQLSSEMNQQEWIEYFELLHNRKPTDEELKVAFNNGELKDELQSAHLKGKIIDSDSDKTAILGVNEVSTPNAQVSSNLKSDNLTSHKKPKGKFSKLFPIILGILVVGMLAFRFVIQNTPEVYQGKFYSDYGEGISLPIEVQLKSKEFKVIMDDAEFNGQVNTETGENGRLEITEVITGGDWEEKSNSDNFYFEYKKFDSELDIYAPFLYDMVVEADSKRSKSLLESFVEIFGYDRQESIREFAEEFSHATLIKVTGDGKEEIEDNASSEEEYDEETDDVIFLYIEVVPANDKKTEIYLDIVEGLPDEFDVESFEIKTIVSEYWTDKVVEKKKLQFTKENDVYRSKLSANYPDGEYSVEVDGKVETNKGTYSFYEYITPTIKDGKFTQETFE